MGYAIGVLECAPARIKGMLRWKLSVLSHLGHIPTFSDEDFYPFKPLALWVLLWILLDVFLLVSGFS